MKFAQYLEAEQVPEWREKYIDYNSLKSAMKVAAKAVNEARTQGTLVYSAPPQAPEAHEGSISMEEVVVIKNGHVEEMEMENGHVKEEEEEEEVRRRREKEVEPVSRSEDSEEGREGGERAGLREREEGEGEHQGARGFLHEEIEEEEEAEEEEVQLKRPARRTREFLKKLKTPRKWVNLRQRKKDPSSSSSSLPGQRKKDSQGGGDWRMLQGGGENANWSNSSFDLKPKVDQLKKWSSGVWNQIKPLHSQRGETDPEEADVVMRRLLFFLLTFFSL